MLRLEYVFEMAKKQVQGRFEGSRAGWLITHICLIAPGHPGVGKAGIDAQSNHFA